MNSSQMKLEREHHRQSVAFAVFFFSVVSHAAVTTFVCMNPSSHSILFRREFCFFVVLSAVTSAVIFLIESFPAFLSALIVKTGAILVATQILSAEYPIPELLLSATVIVEAALYSETLPGILFNTAFLLILLIGDAMKLSTRAFPPAVGHISLLVLILLLVGSTAHLMVFYREQVVALGKRILTLNTAVHNLTNANKAFQLYADNAATKSAALERERITRELHDAVGYALTNVVMSMNAAKVLVKRNPDELERLLETTKKQAEDALKETRETLHQLREIVDSPMRGLSALSHLVRGFSEATGVAVQLNCGNLPTTLGQQIDSAIYRLVQEGMTNAFRHGKADQIRVNLWQSEEEIRIKVWDNGKGAVSLDEGIGLKGMRERFAAIGGVVTPRNVADGFELTAQIPYRRYHAHE